jgi:ubiquinone/menaquinone biosynthesis C-methylase UbiE
MSDTDTHARPDNVALWRHGDYVADYQGSRLARVERFILNRHRADLAGRVLELGCGTGRVTGHLIDVAHEMHGQDIAPSMIDTARQRFPAGIFAVGDMRDLSAYEADSFDAVLAICNLLDALDHADREHTLGEIHRILRPGGLFIMSSHNRAYVPRLHGPAWIVARRPGAMVRNVVRLRHRMRNHRRMRRLQRFEAEYALVNDNSHDYAFLHYFITPPAQVRQLEAHDFQVVEVLDLACNSLAPGETADRHVRVHYVARRPAS